MLALLMSPGEDFEQLFSDCHWFAFMAYLSPVLQILESVGKHGNNVPAVLMDLTDAAETFFSPKICLVSTNTALQIC